MSSAAIPLAAIAAPMVAVSSRANNAVESDLTTIKVYVTAGQVIPGNQLIARIYKEDGSLYGEPIQVINGVFTLELKGRYTGSLLVVLSDASAGGLDYLDEATGDNKTDNMRECFSMFFRIFPL